MFKSSTSLQEWYTLDTDNSQTTVNFPLELRLSCTSGSMGQHDDPYLQSDLYLVQWSNILFGLLNNQDGVVKSQMKHVNGAEVCLSNVCLLPPASSASPTIPRLPTITVHCY